MKKETIPIGRYLELTSEIPEETEIIKFVSTGPKSYSYISSNGDKILKYKGFSLNSKASNYMNFSAMKEMMKTRVEMIEDECGEKQDKTIEISTSMICRNRQLLTINSYFSKFKSTNLQLINV